MTVNEIAKELNITKRAMKYYEEQGLLKVAKDSNGYRNYSEQDVETLRIVSVYRKLGISISDIRKLLKKEDPVYISQRKYMKELQDKGYNDIFEMIKFIDKVGSLLQASYLEDPNYNALSTNSKKMKELVEKFDIN